MNNAFHAPQIGFMIISLIGFTVLMVLLMADVGLRQAGWPQAKRNKTLVSLGGGLVGLYFMIQLLAQSGFFLRQVETIFLQPFAINIAITSMVYTLLLLWRPFRQVVDYVSLGWLGAFNGLRIGFGYAFLAMYELDGFPAFFALKAGYGDILAGVLGLLVAYLVWRNSRYIKPITVLWIVIGLGDFVSVLNAGSHLTPEIAPALEFWPFLMIPNYAVPMFIASQMVAIRAVLRLRLPQVGVLEPVTVKV